MNKYEEMKARQQEEVNASPIFFAFGKTQLIEGMKKIGLSETDTDKICHIGGGGYIKKTDLPTLKAMFARHREERAEAVKADATGRVFIFDMFYTELNNHEFGYTGEYDDTLEALGYTEEDLDSNPALREGFDYAIAKILGYKEEE